MDLAEFDYELPEELIAQAAAAGPGRLAHAGGRSGAAALGGPRFRDLPAFLGPGDCLVLNDSRVFPARCTGIARGAGAAVGKQSQAARVSERRVEVLLLRPVDAGAQRMGRAGASGTQDACRRTCAVRRTIWRLRWWRAANSASARCVSARTATLFDEFEKIGHVPLPPYIKRPDEAADRERYQTVFAHERGSAGRAHGRAAFYARQCSTIAARMAPRSPLSLCTSGSEHFNRCIPERIERPPLHAEHYQHLRGECRAHGRGPPPCSRGHHQRAHHRKRHAVGRSAGDRRRYRHCSSIRVSSSGPPARC